MILVLGGVKKSELFVTVSVSAKRITGILFDFFLCDSNMKTAWEYVPL